MTKVMTYVPKLELLTMYVIKGIEERHVWFKVASCNVDSERLNFSNHKERLRLLG